MFAFLSSSSTGTTLALHASGAYPWLICGRYTNTLGPEEISKQLGEPLGVKVRESAGTRRYNIAPTQEVLAIVAPDGQPQARMLRWGLIPPWAKDLKVGYKMINARMESVASKPAYRALIPQASHRALQIADGYFEWQKPERPGEPRQPFYFQLDGGVPFAFAALWTAAHIDEKRIESITTLTCDSASNHVVAAIHDRMPVILADPDVQRAWLDPSVGAAEALELCGTLRAGRMTAQPANPAVNKAGGVEGPELLIAPAD
jgi:putative SOS response-associated peptidase YedK